MEYVGSDKAMNVGRLSVWPILYGALLVELLMAAALAQMGQRSLAVPVLCVSEPSASEIDSVAEE